MRICFGWHQDAARYGVAGTVPKSIGVPPSSAADVLALRTNFELTQNKGYMVVGEATARVVECARSESALVDIRRLVETVSSVFEAAAMLNENFDILVLGMAYELRPGVDYTAVVNMLRHVKIPIVVLGLSVEDLALRPEDVHPSAIGLATVLNERAALFGVRALSTQRWLANLGLLNAIPLGCPSIHLYSNSVLSISPPDAEPGEQLFATGGYLFRDRERTKQLVQLFRGTRANYVLQDEVFYLPSSVLARMTFSAARMEFGAEEINAIARQEIDLALPFQRYFMFDDMNCWRQCLSWHDVYVGDRFHGAVAALQAGIPAVVICKDVRSLELASFYDLPALSMEEATDIGLRGILLGLLSNTALQRMKETYCIRNETLAARLREVGLQLVGDQRSSPPVICAAPAFGDPAHNRAQRSDVAPGI
jgi:hypothetical protein